MKTSKFYKGWRSAIFLVALFTCLGIMGYVGLTILDLHTSTINLADRSDENQGLFAGRFMKPTLEKRLSLLYSDMPVIKQRHEELMRIIKPKVKEIRFEYAFDSMGENVAAGSRVRDGIGYIILCVPAHMDQFLVFSCKNFENRREVFDTCLYIDLMHELEHLAVDCYIADLFSPGLMDNEDVIWARTCTYTLAPLREIYGKDLSFFEEYYRAWVQFGRPVGYQKDWTMFVRGKYDLAN